MPRAVVVTASDDESRNLSDEAYAAFKESGVSVEVSVLSGQPSSALGEHPLLVRTAEVPTRAKRPANVKLKEQLDAAEVNAMLADAADWKLAIPSGSSTDVLTKGMLQRAWSTDGAGVVTMKLRQATEDEQAVLQNAKESLSSRAGAGRVAAALSAPVTNVGLLALAAGAFVGWKAGEDVARPGLLIAAGICALLSIAASLAGTLLKRTTLRLSRLDLLERNAAPSPWLPNACVALFAVALVLAVFSAVPPASSSPSPRATFGTVTTTQAAGRTRVTFSVTWAHLGASAAKVRTIVAPARGRRQVSVTPKGSDGSVSQRLSVVLTKVPAKVVVTSQAVDDAGALVGDGATHTYDIP